LILVQFEHADGHPNRQRHLGGTPCFAGTRVPVKSLFDHLRLGYTADPFLEQFPTVKREQALALLDQVGDRVSEQAFAGSAK
jgi:uncharacterized protein (DUF433 family)